MPRGGKRIGAGRPTNVKGEAFLKRTVTMLHDQFEYASRVSENLMYSEGLRIIVDEHRKKSKTEVSADKKLIKELKARIKELENQLKDAEKNKKKQATPKKNKQKAEKKSLREQLLEDGCKEYEIDDAYSYVKETYKITDPKEIEIYVPSFAHGYRDVRNQDIIQKEIREKEEALFNKNRDFAKTLKVKYTNLGSGIQLIDKEGYERNFWFDRKTFIPALKKFIKEKL